MLQKPSHRLHPSGAGRFFQRSDPVIARGPWIKARLDEKGEAGHVALRGGFGQAGLGHGDTLAAQFGPGLVLGTLARGQREGEGGASKLQYPLRHQATEV